MSAHAHHHHDHVNHAAGASLTGAARDALVAGGEQWTEMRQAVFESLASFTQPASAYDIADKVSQTLGRRVAANTVYRILDLFVAKNVAMRVESRNAYLANAHPDCLHDCIFLVCDGCGATTHVDDDVLAKGVRETAKAAGFQPERPDLEVKGRCADCS